jgi:hypothetical protein
VLEILGNKTGGFFIDCASGDSAKRSTTLALEDEMRWSGICVEPNPRYHRALLDRRRCSLVSAIVGPADDEPVSFTFQRGGIGRAGVSFDNDVQVDSRAAAANAFNSKTKAAATAAAAAAAAAAESAPALSLNRTHHVEVSL